VGSNCVLVVWSRKRVRNALPTNSVTVVSQSLLVKSANLTSVGVNVENAEACVSFMGGGRFAHVVAAITTHGVPLVVVGGRYASTTVDTTTV